MSSLWRIFLDEHCRGLSWPRLFDRVLIFVWFTQRCFSRLSIFWSRWRNLLLHVFSLSSFPLFFFGSSLISFFWPKHRFSRLLSLWFIFWSSLRMSSIVFDFKWLERYTSPLAQVEENIWCLIFHIMHIHNKCRMKWII